MFSTSYDEARGRFRASAATLGWTCTAYPVPGTGPAGEPLTIDVAISEPHSAGGSAHNALVISSSLHGVEGHFGSAVQSHAMETWAARPAVRDLRVVFIHALNPFGFAWDRRCDQDNVDPNRNFLPDQNLLPDQNRSDDGPSNAVDATTYAALDPLLNPRRPPRALELFLPAILVAALRYGPGELKQALTAGQTAFPRGLFYAGRGPCPTHRVLRQHLSGWLGNAANVVHLDLHSGLGRTGTATLLIDYPIAQHLRSRLDAWFGPAAYELSGSRGVAYQAHGSLGPWCSSGRFGSNYLFAFAEFGTCTNLKVLSALRAENQVHYWDAPDSAMTKRAKRRLREVFCPSSPEWRAQVLGIGARLIDQALEGLAHLPPPEATPFRVG